MVVHVVHGGGAQAVHRWPKWCTIGAIPVVNCEVGTGYPPRAVNHRNAPWFWYHGRQHVPAETSSFPISGKVEKRKRGKEEIMVHSCGSLRGGNRLPTSRLTTEMHHDSDIMVDSMCLPRRPLFRFLANWKRWNHGAFLWLIARWEPVTHLAVNHRNAPWVLYHGRQHVPAELSSFPVSDKAKKRKRRKQEKMKRGKVEKRKRGKEEKRKSWCIPVVNCEVGTGYPPRG